MPRNTQLVEIDLRSGILTNESLYAIGARLRLAQNVVWDYPYPRNPGLGTYGPWLTRQAVYFPVVAATTFTGAKTFRDLGFSGNGALSPNDVYLFGANGSDQYSAWATDGSVIPFAGGVARTTIPSSSKLLGTSTYWDTPGKVPSSGADAAAGIGLLAFSHYFATHLYYLMDDGGSIRSMTTDVTNCPAGAAALAIHLDRLWMLKGGLLTYTDPLTSNAIRTTNVIRVPGDGRCLIPGQLGAVDASGTSHLIVGTASGVHVLDGDPRLGGGTQADFRMLLTGVGMASPHVAAVTPYGTYFLGTDGNLWHIGVGAQTAHVVGDPIRNVLGINNSTGTIDQDGTATGSVVYFHPYLYVFPGGDTTRAYVAEPSPDGIARFWGYLTMNTPTREAIVRGGIDSANSGAGLSAYAPSGAWVPSLHSVDVTPTTAAARYLTCDARTSTSKPNRTPLIETGLINVPGHAVQAMRVILETVKVPQVGGVDVTWTVKAHDAKYNASIAVLVPDAAPVAGVYAFTDNALQHFVFPTPLPAARGVSLQIQATAGSDLGVQRALVELHTTPAQF